jgi:tetrahydromethanopterin S-methyltransferase subunit A
MDDQARIRGAQGKRPFLKNIAQEAVGHFRQTVEVVDLVGGERITEVLEAASRWSARNPGPAQPYKSETVVKPLAGYAPARMAPDPAGYFVVYVDVARQLLSLEHYRKDGVLDTVVEGRTALEVYTPTIEKGLLSRLDHGAYLGRELTRAEHALVTRLPYVQDAAPERPQAAESSASGGPSCGPSCGREVKPDVRGSLRDPLVW